MKTRNAREERDRLRKGKFVSLEEWRCQQERNDLSAQRTDQKKQELASTSKESHRD